jgi:hypothetical protein
MPFVLFLCIVSLPKKDFMIEGCLVVRWRVRNQLESAFGCLFLLSHGVVLCSVCLVGLLGLECGLFYNNKSFFFFPFLWISVFGGWVL